jgi:PAS domain S-box-containing protein
MTIPLPLLALLSLFIAILVGISIFLFVQLRSQKKIAWNQGTYVNGSLDSVWNVKTDKDYFGPRLAVMLGYSPEEATGWSHLLHPEDLQQLEANLKVQFAEKKRDYSFEYRFLSKLGEWKWILCQGNVLEWAQDGKPLKIAGAYHDTTESHRIEEALQILGHISACTQAKGGFVLLVNDIARIVQMKHVLVLRLLDTDRENLHIYAASENGLTFGSEDFETNGMCFSQANYGERLTCFDDARVTFPQENFLRKVNAQSLFVLPFTDRDGSVMGMLLAADERPIDPASSIVKILILFAERIGLEMERSEVDTSLAHSEYRWKFALEGAGDGVWDWNLASNTVSFSRAYKNILGYSDQDFPNQLDTWMAKVHPEDLNAVLAEYERHFHGDTESIYSEYRLKCKSGDYKWVLGRGKVIERGEGDVPLRLVGTLTDITLRRVSEQVLHDTMAKYQSLFASMSEGFAFHKLVLDEAGNADDYIILDVNPAYYKITGYNAEHVVGVRASKLYEMTPPPYLDIYSRVALTGRSEQLETYFPMLNKHFRIAVFSPERGKFATVFTDISLIKESEAALARERNLLKTLIENLPDAIYLKDINYRKTMANKADIANIGVQSEDEILGKTDFEVWPHDVAARFHEHDRYVLETGRALINREEIYSSPGEAPRWLLTSKIPLLDQDRKVIGLIGIGRNITDRKLAEQEIRRLNTELELRVAERTAQLEAVIKELEAFSYSVSHDLRAPLRAISGFTQSFLDEYGQMLDETGLNYIQRVRTASQRMGNLIDDLLNLARISRSELNRRQVDMSEMVEGIAAELQVSDTSRGVEWSIRQGIQVTADANLLRIALENILGNAWKFSSRHVHAKIELDIAEIDARPVYYIRDDGAGFDMAYAGKLFVPFQRMHSISEFEGTGIGLATVQRIIHKHGGEVWVDSAVEKGTTVYFTLS